MIPFVVAAVAVVPTFLLWAYLHELLHVVMADHQVGVKFWSINVIPHRYKTGWRWASASMSYHRQPQGREQAWIMLAPRLVNILPALAFPFFSYMPVEVWPSWIVVFGGGLIDLWVGSWASKPFSDLQKAAAVLEVSPWWLRAAGWLVLLASVSSAILLAMSNWG
jgi:hypothetical protein